MKKALKIGAIIAAVAFLAIQFIRPDRSNPPVQASETLGATMSVPPGVEEILRRSCSDCHSNETVYPWYSNVAPFSWLLDSHIRDGREELNFSVWSKYQPQTQKHKLDEICEMVTSGEMPLPSYLLIQREAVLSEADKKLLCEWSAANSE